jgi:arylsulfatase A-like enzyme
MQLSGQVLAVRQGPWKLIPSPAPFLVNLDDDPAERHNLALRHPGKAHELMRLLADIRR